MDLLLGWLSFYSYFLLNIASKFQKTQHFIKKMLTFEDEIKVCLRM